MRHPHQRTRMEKEKGMGHEAGGESVRDALAVLELELLVLLDHRDHVRLLLGRQAVANHCRRRACVAASARAQLQFSSVQFSPIQFNSTSTCGALIEKADLYEYVLTNST